MRLGALTFPIIGLVVLVAIGLSEAYVRPVTRPDRIEITYWEKWTGDEGEGIQTTVDDFNKSQDKIFVKLLIVSDIANKTMMATSGGIPPDVAGLFGPNVAQYVDNNSVIPLDEFCAQHGLSEAHYIPIYWRMGMYRGHQWALPSTPAATALHFNTTLLEKAGLDPDNPPKTIDELDAFAEKITKKDKRGQIDISGFLPNEPGWWNWAWGYFYGGSLYDGKGNITIDSPTNVKAFEWVQSYAEKYGPQEIQTFKSGFGNFSSPQNGFMQEKVGMELQGVWMANFVAKYSPKVKWAASAFPYPAGRPDLADSSCVEEDILVIPRGAKHPKEAFEFIAYVQSQPAMEKLCLAHKKNSPLAEISDNFWKQHKNPYIRLFDRLARSKNAFSAPKLGIWPEYGNEINNAFDQIMTKKKTAKEALAYVKARMQPKLDQYLRRLKQRGESVESD